MHGMITCTGRRRIRRQSNASTRQQRSASDTFLQSIRIWLTSSLISFMKASASRFPFSTWRSLFSQSAVRSGLLIYSGMTEISSIHLASPAVSVLFVRHSRSLKGAQWQKPGRQVSQGPCVQFLHQNQLFAVLPVTACQGLFNICSKKGLAKIASPDKTYIVLSYSIFLLILIS